MWPGDLPEQRTTDLLGDQVNRYEAIVALLATNSVQAKTWWVTTVGAVATLAVNNHRPGLFAVALGILALFMALDVQYLWLERRFRDGAFDLIAASNRARTSACEKFSRTAHHHGLAGVAPST